MGRGRGVVPTKTKELFLKEGKGECTEENFRLMRYSTRIWLLQEYLRLSLMDARIFTRKERPESIEDIAAFFHEDPDSLKARIPMVEWKVSKALEENPNFFHGYTPVYPEDKVM